MKAKPVIMLHSVGAAQQDWPYNYLSEETALFERKVSYLTETGYQFITHDELYNYMLHGRYLPDKSVMMTFDDGYLDNWVIVYPILKKRGIRFTIYVSQEFVDPRDIRRPNLDDVWAGNYSVDDLQVLGYLSWSEMRAMETSGLVDIQSHTSTHTWHFDNNIIIDFFHPANAHLYPWLFWNHDPTNKYQWMINGWDRALWGLPIYSNNRAMVARKYCETPELNSDLTCYVKDHGGEDFFMNPDWRNTLNRLVDGQWKRNGELGRFESDVEYQMRVEYELIGNKTAIEQALSKEVNYLCWPGGAYNDNLIDLATAYGYKASTVKRGRNTYGDDPRFIHRISSGNPAGADRFPWKYPLFTLRFYIDRFRNKSWALMINQIYRMMGKS